MAKNPGINCAGNFSYTQTLSNGPPTIRSIDVELLELPNGVILPEAIRIIEDGKIVYEKILWEGE